MKPPHSLKVCCRNTSLSVEILEDRTVPAAAAAAADWSLVSTNANQSASDVAAATGTPAAAAGLDSLRQQFPNYTGDGYSVAVIDTGVDYMHPALGGGFGAGHKVVSGYNFVDTTAGSGYVSNQPTPSGNPMDENGHGTNVAGIIAAKDATYSGVAPDADIVALRVLDKNGRGNWTWVDQALQWVIANRSKYNIVAINMSLGSGNYTGYTSDFAQIQADLKTLWDAGVVNVASGGNDFYTNGSTPGIAFPAISQWAVAVGAVYDANYGARSWSSGAVDNVTYKDKIASFTQRSSNLDLLAPGALITSTGLSSGGQANYWTYAGSSQAAPFVTGTAILIRQALDETGRGGLATAQYIVDLMEQTGTTITDNKAASEDNVKHTGLSFPRLNIAAAVNKAAAGVAPDRYEANETQAAAANLGYLPESSQVTGLTLSSKTDVDWYSFIVNTAGAYRIELQPQAGMTPPSMTFYDVTTGKSRTITATLVNGIPTIDVDLRDKVRYYVKVNSPTGQTGTYSLSFNSLGQTPAASPPPALTPDRYESNEVITVAKNIGGQANTTVTGLNLHQQGDVDWLRFQSNVNATQTITVAANGNPGTVQFTFVDLTKGKERTITSTFVNGVATLPISLRTGVNYFLGIRSPAGAVTNYTLKFTVGGAAVAGEAVATGGPAAASASRTSTLDSTFGDDAFDLGADAALLVGTTGAEAKRLAKDAAFSGWAA